MTLRSWIHVAVAILLALAALFIIRLHNASGAPSGAESVAAGRRLAEAWCASCHAIEPRSGGAKTGAPDFAAVANMPSATELSLKVFLRTSHPNMPNIILTGEQTDDLVNYILSLRRN